MSCRTHILFIMGFHKLMLSEFARSSTKMLLIAVIVSILVAGCLCGRPDPKMDGAIDASVANLKTIIAQRVALGNNLGITSAADDLWVASAYKNIGLMLQSKGIRQHLGGDRLQREALENYNMALSIDKGRTVSLNVQILYLKGMLLKMMGLGQESLDSLTKLESDYSLSDHDRSALFFQRADTLQMLGQSKEASQNFRMSLLLRPCRTERYYQYVNACKDVPTYSKQDWLDILDEIQRKLKECESRTGSSTVHRLGSPEDITVQKQQRITVHGDVDEDEEQDEDSDTRLPGVPAIASTGGRHAATATAAAGKEEESSIESYLIFDDHEKEDGISGTNSAVYWALYTAAEKAGRYALAWWYLETANNLEKSLRPVKFERSEAITQADQVFSAFTPELLSSLSYMQGGKASKVPIFIVGFMRSGSTLLETMLDTHSQIWGMGEDSFFNANLTEFRNKLVTVPAHLPNTIVAKQQHFYSTLADYGQAVVREMRALAAERDVSAAPTFTSAAPTAVTTATSAADDYAAASAIDEGTVADQQGEARPDASAAADPGADSANAAAVDASASSSSKKKKDKSNSSKSKASKANGKKQKSKLAHIVDKMLFNYRNIGFLHMVFPDALILHTMRDPLDTLFSCYRCKFDDAGLEWSLDMSDLVLQYTLYLRIMQHFRTVLPGRVVDVRYEELVRRPEAIMRDIIETRLKLPWEPAVLEFHNSNRTVQTHSQSQVKQKLYTHSMGAWTRYEHQLEPMIAELKKQLPKLKKAGALPYADKMNWELDPAFDYHAQPVVIAEE